MSKFQDTMRRVITGDNARVWCHRRACGSRARGRPTDVADTFKTTYLTREDLQMTKPIDALKTIARYIEAQ